MRNKDNDCIRYLMKEMDPSEEILMERAMMEDEDLLIEVESMRQTLQKLDKLPEAEPSSDVTDSIMQKAAEQAEKNRKAQKTFTPVIKYAVAATIALTFTAGGAWLYVDVGGSHQPQVNQSEAESAAPSTASPNVADVQLANTTENSQNVSETDAGSQIEPWIDRNDILRFEDQITNQDSNFQAILESTTQKLQLIDESSTGNGRVNSIQLTGSGN